MPVPGGMVALASRMSLTAAPMNAPPIDRSITIDTLLQQQARWQLPFTIRSRDVIASLSGLTNRSIIFEHQDHKWVLRLNSPVSARLGIDRNREWRVLRQLAPLKIAPQPLYKDANNEILIYEYLEGESLNTSFNQQQEQVRQLIAHYQQVEIEEARFDYLSHLQRYWRQIEQSGLANSRLRAEWQSALPALQQFQRGQWQGVLTHHDLRPDNLLQSTSGIKILDWEYAALGHPGLDYASISEHDQGDGEQLGSLRYWLEKLWHLVQST